MADKLRLLPLLLATIFITGECAVAGSLSSLHPILTIHCGSTPAIASNITTTDRHIDINSRPHLHLLGFSTTITTTETAAKGQPGTEGGLQCHSHRQPGVGADPSYRHVITDVFGRDCGGAKVVGKEAIYSITVILRLKQHTQNQTVAGKEELQSLQTLSCHYGGDSESSTATSHLRLLTERPRPPPRQKTDITLPTSSVHHDDQLRASARQKRSAGKKKRKEQQQGISARHGSTDSPANRHVPRENLHYKPQGFHPDGVMSSHEAGDTMTSSPSVLQLNVIDNDGNMTLVVYPGKEVALELHTAHHTPFGVPVVKRCKATNPVGITHGDKEKPFNPVIMEFGCGLGDILPRASKFRKSYQGYTTKFFSIPAAWTLQTSLLFSCDVIICADIRQCIQTCPVNRNQHTVIPELYDVPILLESQVVTSCPPMDDATGPNGVPWSNLLPPECLPDGHGRQDAYTPFDPDKNYTAGMTGSSVGVHSSLWSWLAGHLHYVIIIGVLALLIVVFMFATFCKMVAMQRQVEQSQKLSVNGNARESGENHQDQTTQTPRPLPRVPPGRGQTPNRHSRQTGDGAPTISFHSDGEVGPPRRHLSNEFHFPSFDNVDNDSTVQKRPSTAPVIVPQARAFAQTRPRPYDVPPSHDRQREIMLMRHSSEPISSTDMSFPRLSPNDQSPSGSSPPPHPRALYARNSSGDLHLSPNSHFHHHLEAFPQTPDLLGSPKQRRASGEVKSFQTTVEENNSDRLTTHVMEIKTPPPTSTATPSAMQGSPGSGSNVTRIPSWKKHQRLGSFTGSTGSNTAERGVVVLGINSLRRHMDRDQQQHQQCQPINSVSKGQPINNAQPRDRRPISAKHCEPISTGQVYYNTPALCSEESDLTEMFKFSREEGGVDDVEHVGRHTGVARAPSSLSNSSRKGVTPVVPIAVNIVEETTRL